MIIVKFCAIYFYCKKGLYRFHCVRTSTVHKEPPGSQAEVDTSEAKEKIHNIMLAERILKLRNILKVKGILNGSLVSILKLSCVYTQSLIYSLFKTPAIA